MLLSFSSLQLSILCAGATLQYRSSRQCWGNFKSPGKHRKTCTSIILLTTMGSSEKCFFTVIVKSSYLNATTTCSPSPAHRSELPGIGTVPVCCRGFQKAALQKHGVAKRQRIFCISSSNGLMLPSWDGLWHHVLTRTSKSRYSSSSQGLHYFCLCYRLCLWYP